MLPYVPRKERELTMSRYLTATAPHGTVSVPPSKSEAQRALLVAALRGLYTGAEEGSPCLVRIPPDASGTLCRDIVTMVRCLRDLGCRIRREDATDLLVSPLTTAAFPQRVVLDCDESGATLRFLVPVAAALCGLPGAPRDMSVTFTGRGRLPQRPLAPLTDVLAAHGARLRHSTEAPEAIGQSLPLTVAGGLLPGAYEVSGEVSSQLISGLLFALPLLQGDSTLTIMGQAVSRPYLGMTLGALRHVTNAVTEVEPYRVYALRGVEAGRSEAPTPTMTVGGDWSAGSFLLALGLLSRHEAGVTVTGLHSNSLQGDAVILPLLRQMGGDIPARDTDGRLALTARRSELHGICADLRDTPDIAPVLAVCAACATGTSVFTGVKRLRDKESDRLSELCSLLARYGVSATVSADGDALTVQGRGGLRVPEDTVIRVESRDHRMIMAAALCATAYGGSVVLACAEAVSKSYPDFWDAMVRLGCHVSC